MVRVQAARPILFSPQASRHRYRRVPGPTRNVAKGPLKSFVSSPTSHPTPKIVYSPGTIARMPQFPPPKISFCHLSPTFRPIMVYFAPQRKGLTMASKITTPFSFWLRTSATASSLEGVYGRSGSSDRAWPARHAAMAIPRMAKMKSRLTVPIPANTTKMSCHYTFALLSERLNLSPVNIYRGRGGDVAAGRLAARARSHLKNHAFALDVVTHG